MLPSPLHPAVVHFPLVLAVLIPLVAAAALYAIHRGVRPLLAWGITTGVAALLALSAWVSVETGQQQEERVEDVVSENVIGNHEERAETFLAASAVLLLVTAAGLVRGKVGSLGRGVAAVGTLGMVGLALSVGSSGGELVYKHNAGSAYAVGGTGGEGGATAREQGEAPRDKGGEDESAERSER